MSINKHRQESLDDILWMTRDLGGIRQPIIIALAKVHYEACLTWDINNLRGHEGTDYSRRRLEFARTAALEHYNTNYGKEKK